VFDLEEVLPLVHVPLLCLVALIQRRGEDVRAAALGDASVLEAASLHREGVPLKHL